MSKIKPFYIKEGTTTLCLNKNKGGWNNYTFSFWAKCEQPFTVYIGSIPAGKIRNWLLQNFIKLLKGVSLCQ